MFHPRKKDWRDEGFLIRVGFLLVATGTRYGRMATMWPFFAE